MVRAWTPYRACAISTAIHAGRYRWLIVDCLTYLSALCDALVRRPVAASQAPSSAAGNGSAT
jgi:hypothetical protein